MNHYWRLKEAVGGAMVLRFELEESGYTSIPKSANLETLSDEWTRMQRGLLHYNACTSMELKSFISERRFRVPEAPFGDAGTQKKQTLGRRQMVNLLKQQDDLQTFDKFLDLPVELQSLVCEKYMHFTTRLSTPTPPPLARTSRHLRQVASPIFYSTQRFVLSYKDHRSYVRGDGDYDERTFKFHQNARLWLSSLSSADLACIRSLYLMTAHSFHGISVELEKSAKGFKVSVNDYSGFATNRQRQRLVTELSKVLGEVAWVDGLRRFRMEDIHALRRALEAAYVGLDSPLGLGG